MAPGWTEGHSHSYGLREDQAQWYMNKPEPGTKCTGGLFEIVPCNSGKSFTYKEARYRLVKYAG